MDQLVLGLLLFGGLFVIIMLGVPVSFGMAGLSLILGYFFWGGESSIVGFVLGTFSQLQEFSWVALPLYIFMAAILRYSDLADDLYEAVYRWFGGIKGGLASGTVIISTLFSAMVGVTTVATATLGLTARPSMLSRGYDEKLTSGVIMAGGTLGILIPPSVLMIIYAMVAQVSAGRMFFAGVIPGLVAALMFIIFSLGLSYIKPDKGPAVSKDERFTLKEKISSLRSVLLPLLVLISVLGSIFGGLATPTEAASFGCAGALLASALNGTLNFSNLKKMLKMTVDLTVMIFWLIIGSIAFARVVQGTGLGISISNLVNEINAGKMVIIIAMILIFFVVGMFMDMAAAIFIAGPVFIPILNLLEVDLIWFGIIFVIMGCVGSMTPPFGMSLFVLKGVAPDVKMSTLYFSTIPFVIIYIILVALVFIFPQLTLWLPNLMIN